MNEEELASPITDIVETERPSEWNWVDDHGIPLRITPDRITRIGIFGVCGWSLIETPLEIDVSNTNTWLLALAVSKLIVILTGTGAIARVRAARATFAFICGAGVLAVAPALPLLYARSVEIAVVSTLECVLKAACLGALFLSSFQKKPSKKRAGTVDPGIR
ncbi:hypothetical protein AAHK20_33155 [Trinickia sp. YCB016]